MNCPNCNHTIPHSLLAKAFASIGGSKPKNYSEEEKQKRRDRLKSVREKRWEKK